MSFSRHFRFTVRLSSILLLGLVAFTGSAPARETLDLSGNWRFQLDDQGVGRRQQWYAAPLAGTDTIHLPGTMDDAGLGPRNTNAPTLEGPWRKYLYYGPAWYQRDIEIPADWKGQRVQLFLERCRWVTAAWLDERYLGTNDSLISPHHYELGSGLTPGHHRLTLCVDNTVKLDLGRFVSVLFGGTWGNLNGVVGRLELRALPTVSIDNVQVYPDAPHRRARVVVRLVNITGQPGQGTIQIADQSVPAQWDGQGGVVDTMVDFPHAKLWDEFNPNLTTVRVRLGNDERQVTFGMREFGTRGTQFTLNGRTIYLRGTLECSIFPLTGYPPCTPAWWEHIFRVEKEYGLNYLRFHSWCPPEAAFAAADRAGIIIQVEGPQANVAAGKNRARDQFVSAELRRIVDTYGNHPSFCLLTLGNEYGGSWAVLTNNVEMLRARDPRHLYTSASNNHQLAGNRQFSVETTGRGIHGPGTEYDLRAVVAADPHPVLGHEIGQWMFYPDFHEIAKYTGVMELKNFELIRDDLARKHLLDREAQFVASSGRFAVRLYKEEIESLIRTRGYGGFALLDLHDYPTQGTALVGPLDEFWDSKGFITPREFRHFCSPVVPLLRLPKRTFTPADTLTATAQLANYGEPDLPQVQPEWTLTGEHDHVVARGKFPLQNLPTGSVSDLGEIHASLATITHPEKLTVTIRLPGTDSINDWNIWVYPTQSPPVPPANVTVCTNWDDARSALTAGQRVILFPAKVNPHQSLAGKFTPVFWSPVWFPSQKPNTMGLLCADHSPLFDQFPTDLASDWQWYDLMQQARLFVLDDTAPDYQPTVAVIDNFARNHKLGVLFEARVGAGTLLVSGFDLPHQTESPAARQLLASLYAYVGSNQFHPTSQLEEDGLARLFTP